MMAIKDFLSGQKLNTINGVQYPYGFKKWLSEVAKVLKVEHGCFKDELITMDNCYKLVSEKDWLPYFMDGFNPRYAVNEDLTNA